MISVPCKATNEIDWITPLKTYIRDTYGDDPERYAEECATLNRLRQDTRGAGKDSTSGRDILYRYYGQLELLDLRFPVDENHIKISFTWFDAFTHKSTSQYSLAFEKASIIFNISAILSAHAAHQTRSEESGLKSAYHSFQASAGMFTYINDNFLHAPSADLSRDTIRAIIHIMLAQAQEVFLEKQIADNKKVGLLAKLSSQAAYLYGQALEGVQENVNKAIFEKVWVLAIQCKYSIMHSMAQYYQALADDDANSHGIAISRLQVADRLAKDALKYATAFPSSVPPNSNLGSDCGSILSGISKRQSSSVSDKLKEFIKDNDYIYHQTVPAEPSLPPVSKLPASKPIPVTELYAGQDIQRITGPDLFAKIVPIAVTESASLYDEEKAKLIRAETETVDQANGEMAASLDYLRLPGALQILKGGFDREIAPDDDFRTWCEDVSSHENPSTIFDTLRESKSAVVEILDRTTKSLDMEEVVCEKMRSKYESEWTQQPSARLTTTLRGDIRNYREALEEASRSDAQLYTKMRQNEREFDEMRLASETGEVDELFRKAVSKARSTASSPAGEGNLLDTDFDDSEPSVPNQINKVEEILKKLSLIKRERNQVLKDLKDKVHNDDISQILILNKKHIPNHESQLFQTELEKFRPHQQRLQQANHKQSSLMKELTMAFNNLLQDKRVRTEQSKYEGVQRQRSAALNRYKRAYQEFLDLEAGLQSAKNWYSDMTETVENLEKNVEAFVNNRRSEGGQLLNEIEKEREAKKMSQAEAERDRLKGLMEKMTIDKPDSPSSSSPKLPARHVPSPLFQPGSAPRYPQTNIQGQYQVPNSPPPGQAPYQNYNPPTQAYASQQPQQHQQATHPPQLNTYGQQAAYNPSAMGRIPGPTSPPPTQSSFGINAMRPGPTSPPPNQTSFNTYGNPQTASMYGAPQGYQPPQHQQPYQQQPGQTGQPGHLNTAHQSSSSISYNFPAGYVPPPPPPGPPPLGPQQSITFDNTTYRQYSGQGSSSQPPPPSDPWAGLNSWK